MINRLVIIGNGFDLAHNLKTSYKDFLIHFWTHIDYYMSLKNLEGMFQSDVPYDQLSHNLYFQFQPDQYSSNPYSALEIEKQFNEYHRQRNFKLDIKNGLIQIERGKQIVIRNELLIYITYHPFENWYDFEETFYNILLEKVEKSDSKYKNDVYQLNVDIYNLKILFRDYLDQHYKQNAGENIENYSSILSIIKPDIQQPGAFDILSEFNIKHKKQLNANISWQNQFGRHFPILLLDFNYTPTVSFYKEKLGPNDIHLQIHGSLETDILLGYGDEMDVNFKKIEELKNNEYLKNMKSFWYLQNNKYKELLSWMDSQEFQVIILGHSCGNSDRTLLKTIFEHDKCWSIKPYYYIKDDESNNYIEITMNISRHFDNKKLMREKIVSLEFCKALPQNMKFSD